MSQKMPIKRCPNHLDADLKLVINPAGACHYAKWLCTQCDRYITHAQKPKTTEALVKRQQEIVLFIRELLDDDLNFILDIYHLPHLNLIQERRYSELYTRYSAT